VSGESREWGWQLVRALSVRQPWARAIARGHKPVLNRCCDTGYRGPVAIAVVNLAGVCGAGAAGGPAAPGRCARGEWAAAYHWQLAHPRPLRWPVLALGQSGLWELVPEVADGLSKFLPDEAVRAGRPG